MSRLQHTYRRRRTPKRSRTIELPGHRDYGDGIDDGKYYRCWNCGFICDVDQDELGGENSRSGATYAQYDDVYSENEPPFYSGIDGENETTPLVPLLGMRSAHVVMKLDADGSESTIRRNWYNDGGTGCPFCHTLNWRGDY